MGKQSLGTFSATDRTDDPIMMIGVHGNFWGAVAPAARMEALLAAHVIKASIGKDLAKPYTTKWWDYRRMAPGHCFGLFADRYYKAFKTASRTFLAHARRRADSNVDIRKSAAVIGVGAAQYQPETVFERDRGHITGMWKAMQVADDFGLPYDHFCRLAFEVTIDRKWNRLPKPQQLYSADVAAQALDAWDETLKQRLVAAEHPMFLAENYAGMAVQDEYREWLIEKIQQRADPAIVLFTTVYQRPQLPLALVEPLFPAATLNRARLLAA